MVRRFVFPLLLVLCVVKGFAQHGSLNPAFEKIPFDQWLNERDQSTFRWAATVSRPELSFHQRLIARAEIKLDGRDLVSRHTGELVFFVQFTDSAGSRFQDFTSIDLSHVKEDIKAANVEYSHAAFFLPGNYKMAVAILDTATGEHSTRQIDFRIAPPSQNILLEEWRHLPPVEFLGQEQSPDSWFLPRIRGASQWAAAVQTPTRINVILNVAAPVPGPGFRSRPTPSSGLPALLPTLKVISQTGSSSLAENVELLDLSRRRAVYQQNKVDELDWPRLKASLGEASTASIDIHSLSEQHHDAQFFVSSVRNILRTSERPCVLIVLSTSVAFDTGEDLDPISLEALPACHVFYIRYHAAPQFMHPFGPDMGRHGRGSRMEGPLTPYPPVQDVVDQLEATLKPLSPKVFDVEKPEQMTKALADIEKTMLNSEGKSSR